MKGQRSDNLSCCWHLQCWSAWQQPSCFPLSLLGELGQQSHRNAQEKTQHAGGAGGPGAFPYLLRQSWLESRSSHGTLGSCTAIIDKDGCRITRDLRLRWPLWSWSYSLDLWKKSDIKSLLLKDPHPHQCANPGYLGGSVDFPQPYSHTGPDPMTRKEYLRGYMVHYYLWRNVQCFLVHARLYI